jgi:hypothetical protein
MQETTEFHNTLNKEENILLIVDFFHRSMMHHAMWFAEVVQHLGKDKAFQALNEVYKTSYNIQIKRFSKTLGFEIENNIPKPLLELPDETINTLLENVAANWLANDGIWFQAIESASGMADAKHCNDSCWAKFSPVEAWATKRILNLPEQAGLEGLKQALQFRMYAFINKQSITDETPDSFIFRMNDCRVQNARKRKGMDDYPCKSGGTVEYTSFAQAIDTRIQTQCVACPPDEHPEKWYCAWKFTLVEN